MTTTDALGTADLEAIQARALFELEVFEIQRQSRALWEALKRDPGNPRLKARIDRLDALLLALSGDPAALAGQSSVLAGQADSVNVD
ncbi:hypothetical protein ACFVJK_36850 [Streptomyces sp. NPDC127172]|uniref:hypothetical protein n=1 Tax=Streptomyces sp. NPDC127172 TaxID=3345382 RepID=UPI003638F564